MAGQDYDADFVPLTVFRHSFSERLILTLKQPGLSEVGCVSRQVVVRTGFSVRTSLRDSSDEVEGLRLVGVERYCKA